MFHFLFNDIFNFTKRLITISNSVSICVLKLRKKLNIIFCLIVDFMYENVKAINKWFELKIEHQYVCIYYKWYVKRSEKKTLTQGRKRIKIMRLNVIGSCSDETNCVVVTFERKEDGVAKKVASRTILHHIIMMIFHAWKSRHSSPLWWMYTLEMQKRLLRWTFFEMSHYIQIQSHNATLAFINCAIDNPQCLYWFVCIDKGKMPSERDKRAKK